MGHQTIDLLVSIRDWGRRTRWLRMHRRFLMITNLVWLAILPSAAKAGAEAPACVQAALRGERDARSKAIRLLTSDDEDELREGLVCGALLRDRTLVGRIAALATHSSLVVRSEAGVLLAQFVDHRPAANAIGAMLEREKDSSVEFNVVEQLYGWTKPWFVDRLLARLAFHKAQNEHFNCAGVVRGLADFSGTNPKALKAIRSLLQKPIRSCDVTSTMRALAVPPGRKRPKAIQRLIEDRLQDPELDATKRGVACEVLATFGSPSAFRAVSARIERCEEGECEDCVWALAGFERRSALEVAKRAMKNANPDAARAARELLDLDSSPNKRSDVLGRLKDNNLGDIFWRNDFISMAALWSDGIDASTLEELILMESVGQVFLGWERLSIGYLRRFGHDGERVARLLDRTKRFTVTQSVLLKHAAGRPSPEVCEALSRLAATSGPEDALPLVRARWTGACPAPSRRP
ncbi:MAG: hypothetical protein IPK13_28135 [Deltaproteobacteria bacterium]|nr:hypothetical protein [Deltaproteobacteria bacterium]